MNETEPCQIVEVDREPVLVRGDVGGWDDADRAAFGEIVRAAKAKYAAEQCMAAETLRLVRKCMDVAAHDPTATVGSLLASLDRIIGVSS